MGPWSFRDCIRVKRGCFGLRACLRPLADFAAFDVGVYRLLHLWPPVLSEDQFLRFFNAWVSCKDVVMALHNDLTSEGGFSGDVNASVVLQEPAFTGDSLFVIEGSFDPLVPEFLLSSGILDFGMYFVGCGHYECPEMCGLEDDNIPVVSFPWLWLSRQDSKSAFLLRVPGLWWRTK